MDLLIITNHNTHSAYDSIYMIARNLSERVNGIDVYISSTFIDANNFSCRDSKVSAKLYSQNFTYGSRSEFFEEKETGTRELSSFDAIFFRVDRVIDDPEAIYRYFHFVYKCAPDAKYVNHPLGLEKTKSKEFLTQFPDQCPYFEILNSFQEVTNLTERFPIVLKPLSGYGGDGIVKVKNIDTISVEGKDLVGADARKFFEANDKTMYPIMGMQYLSRVSEGDKRIVVVSGECLGAVLRVPQSGSWLANLAQGATSHPAEPDTDELEIIRKIDKVLRKEGILLYGIDTLVADNGKRKLSEINTANVGGFLQIEQTSGRPILSRVSELIEQELLNNG